MKHKRWIALLLAAVLAVGAMSVTAFAAENTEPEAETTTEGSAAKPCRGKHGHKDKVAEPENAVGKDVARETALADAGVSAEDVGKVKARVTKLEDGTVIYRVSFTSGELWYRYKIDAVTGEILDKATEDAAAHETAKAERKERSNKSAESSEDGIETAGRGPRHGSGRHGSRGSGTDEAAPEAENNGGRKHGADSKSAEPTAEEGSSL